MTPEGNEHRGQLCGRALGVLRAAHSIACVLETWVWVTPQGREEEVVRIYSQVTSNLSQLTSSLVPPPR